MEIFNLKCIQNYFSIRFSLMVAYIFKLPCNKVSVLNEVLLNPLIANPTKWSNTLKQLAGESWPTV